MDWLLSHEKLDGPINICAPNPAINEDMMKLFRQVCARPFGLPATHWMLEIGAIFLRTETELIIKSRRVFPRRLSESGFKFQFPLLPDALQDLTRKLET